MRGKGVAMALLLLMAASSSGCLGFGEPRVEPVPEPEAATPFPDFDLVDHENRSVNRSSMLGITWVAYFSAPWCKHCELTLEAVDRAIPADRLLVFSKDDTGRYDMAEWLNETEGELNRTIERPFIDGPELAKAVNVTGIPHLDFVDGTGSIVLTSKGALTDVDVIAGYFRQAEESTTAAQI